MGFGGFPVGLWSGCLVGLRWLFVVGLLRIFGGFARVAVGSAWRGLAVGRGFGLRGGSLSLSTNHCHNPHESYTKHEHELELPMKHGTAW